ncbi:hypothetical protein POM88_053988 [Heracleum sosnowskyi]|uniref:MHD domain-containing protein n=1 Tax=Heracleum sosnowskyi TaxID=360622 RepID=A0AAD8LV57_9APIA|nr:hypothetical protein POM88_053988 [Heracleum sosnowskyi]
MNVSRMNKGIRRREKEGATYRHLGDRSRTRMRTVVALTHHAARFTAAHLCSVHSVFDEQASPLATLLFWAECMLGAEFKLPSIISEEESADRKAPISLKLEIPYFTVSGIQECMLGAEFKLPSIISEEESADRKAPISLKLEIPYFTVSGIQECMLGAEFKLPSIISEEESADRKAPISLKLEIPYFTVSGIQVRHLKVIEKSGYQPLPWVEV